MVQLRHHQQNRIITLMPNRSANWSQTKKLMAVMAFFVLLIALAWMFVGVWMILPFAGLEVGLLAFLMYRVSYSTYQKQIITLQGDRLMFQAGVYYPNRNCEFNLHDLAVHTIEPKLPLDQTQLFLQDSTQRVEIAQFLNQDDRKVLIEHFKRAGIHVQRDLWWRQT
jgi:uncharacterized membrane protein